MKLRAIRLSGVKKFGHPGVVIEGIGDSVNLLLAPNEAGKSTLLYALQTVLQTPHSRGGVKFEKDIKPYISEDAPYIEADLEIDQKLYRVRKRYLSRKMAAVIDVAANQTIADGSDVDDWLGAVLNRDEKGNAPGGLLWIEQKRSFLPPVPAIDAGQQVMTRLHQEVSSAVGGDGVQKIRAVADVQRGQIVTAKTDKPQAAYKQALAAKADAQRHLADLIRRIEETAEHRNELQVCTAKLKSHSAPDHVAHLEQARASADERWQAVKAKSDHLSGLEKQLMLTEAALARQTQDLEKLKSAQQQIEKNARTRVALEADIAEQAKLVASYAKAAADTQQIWQSLDAQLRQTQAGLDRCHKFERKRGLELELERVKQAIASVKAAEAKRHTAQQITNAITLQPDSVDTLDGLKRAVDIAVAKLEAQRTTVSVTYEPGSKNRVRDGDVELRDGEARDIRGRVDLTLDGIGTLTIATGEGQGIAEAEAVARRAEAAFHEALQQSGVRSLAEARACAQQKLEAFQTIAMADEDIARHAPDGVHALSATEARLSAQIADFGDIEPGDKSAADLEQNLASLRQQEGDAHQGRQQAQDAHESAKKKAHTLSLDLERLELGQKQLVETYGDPEQWGKNIAQLTAAKTADQTNAAALRNRIEDARAAVKDLEVLRQAKQQADGAVSENQQAQSALKEKISLLHGRLDAATGLEDELSETQGQLDRASRQVATHEAHLRALDLVLKAIASAESETQTAFVAPVMRELAPLVDLVFADGMLALDGQLAPETLRRNKVIEAFSSLSDGTQEQLGILVRLAFAQVLARQGLALPVVLDDALVYSDDERIVKMFAALSDVGRSVQVLVFSCRQKVFEQLQGTRLQLAPWQPDQAK